MTSRPVVSKLTLSSRTSATSLCIKVLTKFLDLSLNLTVPLQVTTASLLSPTMILVFSGLMSTNIEDK